MKTGQAYPSKFLKAGNLTFDGSTVTIAGYEMKDSFGIMKPEMSFVGKDKVLTLNKTNSDIIEAVYGDEMDDWIGKKITLFAGTTRYKGKMVDCVSVRVPDAQGGASEGFEGPAGPDSESTPKDDGRTYSEAPEEEIDDIPF